MINGEAGNDRLENYGADKSKIDGGATNCLIKYNAGDGTDTVVGFVTSSSLSIADSDYSTTKSGDDIIVTVGDGKIILIGAASLDSVNIQGSLSSGLSDPKLITGTNGDDSIVNTIEGAIIQALDGNDTIDNGSYNGDYHFGGNNVSIDGGQGNDSISNTYDSVLISGGMGDDNINSYGSKVTILGGAGNDDIQNNGDNVSVSGDDGNDYIFFSHMASYCTISGGKGNDSIDNYNGKNSFIIYNDGDGNDLISGFNTTSTLQIGDGTGTYSTFLSSDDVIVNVGEGKITLEGALKLNGCNIRGNWVSGTTEEDDNIYNSERGSNLTINAFGGNDTIRNYGESVTINGGAGNDSVYNQASNVTIDGSADNDTISNGYYVDSSDYQKGGNNVSIAGGENNDLIRNYGESVTINGGAGDDCLYNQGRRNVLVLTIGGEGDDYIEYSCAINSSVEGGAGNDTIYNIFGESNSNSINAGAGNDYIAYYGTNSTLNGGDGSDTISNHGRYSVLNSGAGNDVISLASTAKYNLINYAEGDGKDVVYGFNETSTLQIAAGNYSTKKSGDDIIVTVGTGKITLVEAASLSSANINFAKTEWKLNGTMATYGTTTETLISVNGVKSLDGISLSGTKVTLMEAALGTDKVTISDGYTLKLGSDVTKSSKTTAWSLNKTTATYKQTTTEGYMLANNVITYSPKSVETLATVKGVKSTDGLKVSGKTITVSAASLGTSKVTVNDGYTLKLGSDVTKPKTKKAAWNLSGSTATYKSSYKTAGYTLADNQISYAKATTATTLATVKGAKSVDGLSVSGKKITLKNAALADKVTVSGGYEFDFAKDYTNATITGSKNNDTITARGAKVLINAGAGDDTIKAFGSAITVKGGSGNDKLLGGTGNDSLNGGDGNDTLSGGSGADKLLGGAGNDSLNGGAGKDTLSGGNGDDKLIGSSGNDSLSGGDGNDYLAGGADSDKLYGGKGDDTLKGGSGNDSLWGDSGADTFIYSAGDGKDVIYGFDSKDTLTLDNLSFTTSYSESKGTITFNVSGGSITLKDFTATTFHVNNDVYKISNGKFKKQ